MRIWTEHVRFVVTPQEIRTVERIMQTHELETVSQTWRYILKVAAKNLLQNEPAIQIRQGEPAHE